MHIDPTRSLGSQPNQALASVLRPSASANSDFLDQLAPMPTALTDNNDQRSQLGILPAVASTHSALELNDASSSVYGQQQNAGAKGDKLRETFQQFVGQTFFGELIKSYRSTQQPTAYFHGGQAEKIFQGQLDQVLSESLSERSADKIADPMFELFMLRRQS
ncbi:MAG: rod-binding protein [Pirellulaceae bacterium]|nr:rod-binding protein [Pirellulaceae bacterium]